MITFKSRFFIFLVAVGILLSTVIPASAGSYNYVDVPVYEPTADYTAGYIWLSDGSNWMLIWWQCSFAAEYSIPPEEILNVPLQFYFGIDKNGTVDQKVHIYLSPAVDVGDLDYITIRVSVIGSSFPSRTYTYENTDPGAFPSVSLSNGLYTVQNLYKVTFIGAGNVGAVTFYNRTGSLSTSYHLNNLSLPRFLGQNVVIDGTIQIGSTTEQNNAIKDVADRLDMAADKLETLASHMQVNRPQLDSIGDSTPIDITFQNNAVLASLGAILNVDIVQTLIIASLGIAILFLILRGTLV